MSARNKVRCPQAQWHAVVCGLLLAVCLGACNLNRPIDIELPPYQPELVVECYLQPGAPYLLVLTESSSYFDPARLTFIQDAEVVIEHKGIRQSLEPTYLPFPDNVPELQILKPIVGEQLFFYASAQLVPEDYESEFSLEIRTADGRSLQATTFIPPPVVMEEIEWKFDEQDSLAFVITRIQDDPDKANFYRRVLHKNSLANNPEQDFSVSDELLNGQKIPFGTGYDYKRGDTLIFSLYHITEAYYHFLETRDAAITANLSPFAQPAVVRSNIAGGIGIFTGFSLDRQEVIIE